MQIGKRRSTNTENELIFHEAMICWGKTNGIYQQTFFLSRTKRVLKRFYQFSCNHCRTYFSEFTKILAV